MGEYTTQETTSTNSQNEQEKETTISWWINVPCSDTTFSGSFSFPSSKWEKLTEEERSQKILEDIGEYFMSGGGKDYLEIY